MSHARTAAALLGLALAGATMARASDPPPSAEGWSLAIRPYLWNASFDGSLDTGTDQGGGGGDFGNSYQFFTLANLHRVAMGEVEAARGPWRLHLDGLYIAYEDDFEILGGRVQSTLSLDGAIVEAAVEHALEGLPFHVLGGLRWQRVRTAFRVNDRGLVENELAWTDPFLGLASRARWGSAWELLVRGDIGGATFGSQFAYRMEGQLRYDVASWLDCTLGYRHLKVGHRKGDYRLDLALTGWLLGLGVTF